MMRESGVRRAGLPVNNVISAGFGMICSCEKAAGRKADRASAGIMNFMDTVIGTKTADTIFHGEFVFLALGTEYCFFMLVSSLEGLCPGEGVVSVYG